MEQSSDEEFDELDIWEYFFHFNYKLTLIWIVKDRIFACMHVFINALGTGILTWIIIEYFSGAGSLMCLNGNSLKWN